VRPHSEHLHGLGIVEDLVDQAMLNADAPRIRAGQVSDELLERGRRLVGVLREDRADYNVPESILPDRFRWRKLYL
jgi:hypothetical protein